MLLLKKLRDAFNVQEGSASEKILFIAGGVLVGLLLLWLLLKLLTPVIHSGCRFILQESPDTLQKQIREAAVEATVVSTGNISRRIVAVGLLRANNEVMLKAETNGIINEILFKEGSDVEEGEVLIKFADKDSLAALKQAEAELSLYTTEFERIARLHQKNIQSTKQLEEVQSKRDITAAKLDEARALLEKKTLKAPFSGRIGLIQVSPGAYVQAGQELVRIVDSTPIKLDFRVPEVYINDVGVGQIAEVTIDGFKNEKFQFEVEALDSKVDESSHSLALRASNPNSDLLLKAGLFVTVSLIIGENSNAIVIPETALLREADMEFVWLVERGKVKRQRVIVSTREQGKVEISSPLRQGMLIVTSGQVRLSEGMKVRITNMPELQASGTPE